MRQNPGGHAGIEIDRLFLKLDGDPGTVGEIFTKMRFFEFEQRTRVP